MDIFRERELLESQERDLEHNSMYDSLPIPKHKFIKKVIALYVGETVWLENKGPRVITSVNIQDGSHVHFLTLAEEYGRFSIDRVSKYKVIEHLDFVDSIKSLDWKFVYKYGLPLCFIPVELTLIAFCLLLDAELVLFYDIDFELGLLIFFASFLTSSSVYLIVNHVKKFVKKVLSIILNRNEEERRRIMYEEQGLAPLMPQPIIERNPDRDRGRVQRIEGGGGFQYNAGEARAVGEFPVRAEAVEVAVDDMENFAVAVGTANEAVDFLNVEDEEEVWLDNEE